MCVELRVEHPTNHVEHRLERDRNFVKVSGKPRQGFEHVGVRKRVKLMDLPTTSLPSGPMEIPGWLPSTVSAGDLPI